MPSERICEAAPQTEDVQPDISRVIAPAAPEHAQVFMGPLACDREVAIFSKSALDDVTLRASAATAE